MGKELCTIQHVLSRVIVEKPFGYNLKTAQRLDKRLMEVFDERQVYRIDHYLGKEAFQNIFAFRFANNWFEHLWNKDHVLEIQLNALETVGLEGRYSYYDGSGAIRDMVQSHLLQFLAFLTMDAPRDLSSFSLREKKEAVLAATRPHQGKITMVQGQYSGYRKEKGIPSTSKTETYVAMKLEINSPRWKGVPIYVRTGKALGRKDTGAVVVFKQPKTIYPSEAPVNKIALQIAPSPSISLHLNVQSGEFGMDLDQAAMHYCRGEHREEAAVGDYERLLLDVVLGDQKLFTSSKEVLSAWKIVDPFLARAARRKPVAYKKGSEGPTEARSMMLKDGTDWLAIHSSCPIHV